jgi:hypothetical protein
MNRRICLGRLDLRQHRLQPLLELAAVLGPGDEGPHVQGHQPLLLQPLGDVTGDDAPGEPLDDRRLADTRLADQDRVVLRPPGEDLHHPADLLVAADHRVHLSLAGQRREVAAVLLQGLVGRLGVLAGHPLGAADLLQGGEEGVAGEIRLFQGVGGPAAVAAEERQEEVLHRDVLILERLRLLFRLVGDPAGRLVEVGLAGALAGHRGELREVRLHRLLYRRRRHAGDADQLRHQPLLLFQERREEVERHQPLVAVAGGDRLREL